ncbi:peptidoglycan DD-metalloendopeptidase family protein [Pseudidiomarina donghaiensis]|uniref:Peptidase M23 n=1 Tax=Pseudidiomarina donghaiensis TaxID=519452 RepID=A0A432XM64_9GAMM|nr:peptidoglycan DD-metalloendopeptidase family protein [Pseudidiomarina donghaiensis]RUO49798.1 peptidase M23 [Pseudidiomarina donghaiensis]SFV21882.1 lipoprotein NlpD [Pseudidiomarina donghaiensis]
MFGRVDFYLVFTLLMALVLSGCAQPSEPAPVTRLYKGKSIHDFERASLASPQYEVSQGDTLYSIAFRANVDVRDVAKWNQIPAPYIIVPGQKISLQAPTPARTQSIASQPKKGYVDKQNKSKAVTVKQQAQPARAVTSVGKPAVLSSNSEPALPASKDIRWQWPTPAKVTREFSTAEAGNKGIDFAGSEGDPVFAAASGKVVYAGNALKGYGQLIILKHNDDYITAYAHNQKLLVKEQQWVNKGEEIATMGDTDAERVKLHFQVRFRGKSVNPRHYLPRGTQ